jgi:hypothetical protein
MNSACPSSSSTTRLSKMMNPLWDRQMTHSRLSLKNRKKLTFVLNLLPIFIWSSGFCRKEKVIIFGQKILKKTKWCWVVDLNLVLLWFCSSMNLLRLHKCPKIDIFLMIIKAVYHFLIYIQIVSPELLVIVVLLRKFEWFLFNFIILLFSFFFKNSCFSFNFHFLINIKVD